MKHANGLPERGCVVSVTAVVDRGLGRLRRTQIVDHAAAAVSGSDRIAAAVELAG